MKARKTGAPYSASSKSMYETCPFQYYNIKMLGIKEYRSPPNEASIFGNKVHERMEKCLLNDRPFTYEMEDHTWILDDFRSHPGLKLGEQKLAVDRRWKPVDVDYRSGKMWEMGILDLVSLNDKAAVVGDLKTGKRKFSQAEDRNRWIWSHHVAGPAPTDEQLKWVSDKNDVVLDVSEQAVQYAMLVLLHFPQVQDVTMKFYWSHLDHKVIDVFEFNRQADAESILQTCLSIPTQIEESIETNFWPKKKSGLCKGWCGVVVCKHWKPREI